MKKQILVTGGLGYIGSHTVVELIESGFDVLIIDDLSNSKIEVLDGIEAITNQRPKFEQLDLKDNNALKLLLEKEKVDGIIHFAAHKAVGESVKNPLKYYQNNLLGLLNLLNNVDTLNLNYLIFSSSCTVYGQADELPITEQAPFKKAESPYGKTKQMCEEILEDFTKAQNKQMISLRYFNPIGAHVSTKIGELPLGVPDNLIPYVTQTAAGIRKQLSVFGSDYPTPDGTAIRDYIYVSDLAKAHVLALKRLLNKENEQDYEVYNLGTGKGSSVLEVIQAFESVNDLKLNYKITDRRSGDITAAYANNQLANEKLGWQPTTNLETALKTAWDWQKGLETFQE